LYLLASKVSSRYYGAHAKLQKAQAPTPYAYPISVWLGWHRAGFNPNPPPIRSGNPQPDIETAWIQMEAERGGSSRVLTAMMSRSRQGMLSPPVKKLPKDSKKRPIFTARSSSSGSNVGASIPDFLLSSEGGEEDEATHPRQTPPSIRSSAKRSKLPDASSGEERLTAHAGEHGGLVLGQVLQPLLVVLGPPAKSSSVPRAARRRYRRLRPNRFVGGDGEEKPRRGGRTPPHHHLLRRLQLRSQSVHGWQAGSAMRPADWEEGDGGKGRAAARADRGCRGGARVGKEEGRRREGVD